MEKIKLYLAVLIALCCSGVWAQDITKAQMEQEVKKILQGVDSQQRGGSLQDHEFVIALYQQLLQRNPSADEVFVVTSLLTGNHHQKCECHKVRVPRSQILSLLFAKKLNSSTITWPAIQEHLETLQNLDLNTVPFGEVSLRKNNKAATNSPPQDLEPKAHREGYRLYHGYLHSHTSYSDGSGTPQEAYEMARDVAGLDFFSVTDHAELLYLWPWENNWEKTLKVAEEYNQDGEFVALHGFEWSSPLFGHINIIHSKDFTDCIRSLEVKDIYDWIHARRDTIARYNHPGEVDMLSVEFEHFKLYAHVIRQMTGVEMHNGGNGIRHYFDSKSYSGDKNHLDEALQKGWKVGVVGGQDNHGGKWGIRNNFLVGVWAKSLTREGILEAYRERRTFATEDRNMGLSFTMDGAEMGSRLTLGEKRAVISLWDLDRENFVKVDLYRSGKLLKSFPLEGKTPKLSYSVVTQANEYYYILAEQEDGDLALSSPIWISE